MTSGFDYGNWPVIRANSANCDWDIVEMEWGFIPAYLRNREDVDKFRHGYTDLKGKFHVPMTTLNAVGEELLQTGKMYRDAALNRRCLFLSSGFYEWRHEFPIGKKGLPLKTSVKYPYNIRVKGDQKYFLIAGIYQNWIDKDTGETVDTCALVTTRANALMEQVHKTKKRMPTILSDELAGEWISEGLSEERIIEIATYQFSAKKMEAHAIPKDFLPENFNTRGFQN